MRDFYEIYLPREDTYLLESVLSKIDLRGKRVLEIGCGSGYLSCYCAKHKAIVTAIDINTKAISYAKKEAEKEHLKIDFSLSNMFESLDAKEKYDLIFFNPPYLVSDSLDFLALDGGKDGREVIDKFLKTFDNHLELNGQVLLLHTDKNNLKKTKEILAKKKFKFEIVAKQHLFFEELYILKISKELR